VVFEIEITQKLGGGHGGSGGDEGEK